MPTPPTIAGVETGAWALPENDTREQNVSVGQAADGSFKFRKYRASDRLVTIILKSKTDAIKDALVAALEADVDYNVELHPADHIDLGGGDGTAINAQWIDKTFIAKKINHEAWDIELNFVRTS